jgi:threonine dehydratase
MNSRISPDRIEAAARLIDPLFTRTPQFVSESLSERLGARLICKVETANPLRSFKGRGADFFVSGLAEKPVRLVCASAGNFGQGLAFAARKHGIALEVFAAEQANPLKVEQMRRLGARVHLTGADLDEAKEAAKRYAVERELRFVEDGRELAITEGAGTIGLELCQWPEPLDAIIVPVGNGALISGIATWFKAKHPSTKIIGVCARGAPAMERSWRSGELAVTENVRTIADGIAVRLPIPEALQDMQGVVDEMLLLEDDATRAAMRLLFAELGLVIEPAGAIGVAALLEQPARFAGQTLATILCGGNLTPEQVRVWLC